MTNQPLRCPCKIAEMEGQRRRVRGGGHEAEVELKSLNVGPDDDAKAWLLQDREWKRRKRDSRK